MEIIGQSRTAEPPSAKEAALLRASLEGSHRPAAGSWLLCFARLHDDPQGAVRQWSEYCQAEQLVLRRTPGDSEQQILVTLLRTQINWLEKAHRTEEIPVPPCGGCWTWSWTIRTRWASWWNLVDQQAWKVIEETAARLPARFADQPMLLYAPRSAQEGLGQKEKAEATAAGPGVTPPRWTGRM